MSGKRTWWPADWADEIMPPARDDPNGFLIDAGGHYWLGYALDADDVNEHEKRQFQRYLNSGDIVNFICSDDLGELELRMKPGGGYELAAGVVVEGATNFWEPGNFEVLGDTLDEFAQAWFEAMGPIDETIRISVRMARWSDHLPHKLTVEYPPGAGRPRPRFEAVSKAEARQ